MAKINQIDLDKICKDFFANPDNSKKVSPETKTFIGLSESLNLSYFNIKINRYSNLLKKQFHEYLTELGFKIEPKPDGIKGIFYSSLNYNGDLIMDWDKPNIRVGIYPEASMFFD